jgi:iron complex outermembrane receptor protein
MKNQAGFPLCAVSAAVASLLACGVLPALAQSAPERVEITGSNIKRLATETAGAVEVITREDIRQTGATTLRQILDTVTGSSSALTDNGNSSSFAPGASGTALRNLGTSATLVLLNGRRIGNFALANGGKDTFVNVDFLPADVIDRIEILKDGASAVYGSEAMAGVINVITRKFYDGVGLSASFQNNRVELGQQRTASIVAGIGEAAGRRLTGYGNLEFYQRDGYMFSEILPLFPEWHRVNVNPALGAPSTISYPGNFLINPPAYTTRSAFPSCTNKNTAGACVTDLNPITQSSDAAERLNFFGALNYRLSDKTQLFADLLASKTRTNYLSLPLGINAPTTPFRWVDGRTGTLQEVAKPLVPVTNPLNTFGRPVGLEYRFMDPGIDYNIPTTADAYRLTLGARGELRGWDWEAAYIRAQGQAQSQGKSLHRVDFVNAIRNSEYVIGGNNSQALLDRMIRTAGVDGKNTTDMVDMRITGELFKAPFPVQAAFGVDLRSEKIFIKSSTEAFNAELIGRGSLLTDATGNTTSAFAELEAQPLKQLTANVAVRWDKTGSYEGAFTPKVGLKYVVSPQLLVRGTVGEGFRAPNVVETLGKGGLTGFFNSFRDEKRCDTATKIRDILATGNATDKLDGNAAFTSGCSVSVPAAVSSNPNLKPERSTNKTFGLVFEPSRHFTMSADYFEIERRDEIAYQDPNFLVTKEDDPLWASFVRRSPLTPQDQYWAQRANELSPGANLAWPRGQLITIFLGYDNLLKTRASGVDVEMKSRHKWDDVGDVTLGYNATYNIRVQAWDTAKADYLPNLVGLNGYPRLTSTLSASLRTRDWTFGMRYTFKSEQSLAGQFDGAQWSGENCPKTRPNKGDLPCYIESDDSVGLNIAYRGFKNTQLALNIANLMDQEAPVNLKSGFSLRTWSYKVGVTHKF